MLALAGAAVLVAGNVAPAQDREPVNEDEWYDPTDWFDGNNIEWDDTYDANESYGDDSYRYGDTYPGDTVYDDWYDYGHWDSTSGGDSRYGWHYDWNPRTRSWDHEFGWYDSYYDTMDSYGRHYVWNTTQDRWEPKYGWYEEYYAFPEKVNASSRNEERQQDDADRMTLSGTVDSFNRKRLEGQKASHTLVKIRLENGKSRIVDLGPSVDLEQLDLAGGDTIRVRGRTHEVSGKRVLMVENLRVSGQKIPTHWTPPRTDGKDGRKGKSDDQRTRSRHDVTFQGILAGFHETQMSGSKDDHLLVRMRMEDGSTRVVDFGPEKELGDLDLEQDQHAVIRGYTREMDGRSILVADVVRIDGETMRLGDTRAMNASSPKRDAGSKQDSASGASR